MVGLVVVSHSAALAAAAVGLASEMLGSSTLAIEVAAGLEDGAFGTDAMAILEAVTRADSASGDGVVVLMDLGSAVLSAETALEFLDDEVRSRVVLCPAPLVEGLVVAAVSAAGGATAAEVAAEATSALAAKQAQLGPVPSVASTPAAATPDGSSLQFTVDAEHGLHARPAAALVRLVTAADAEVELRNLTTGSAWVPGASLSRVATLGVLQGHHVEARATGPGAQDFLTALKSLSEANFGDPPPTAQPSPPPPAQPSPAPLAQPSPAQPSPAQPSPAQPSPARPLPAPPAPPTSTAPASTATRPPVSRLAGSPGIGIGPAWRWAAEFDLEHVPESGPDSETGDLDEALAIARQEIRDASAGAGPEAGIFDAHLALLDDPDLTGRAKALIESGEPPLKAWARAALTVAREFDALPDPYLSARAADVRAVAGQVARALLGLADENVNRPGILVAHDLTPRQASGLDPAVVDGVVLEAGSSTSHSLILLRMRGIPAVVGVGVLDVVDGTTIALDGIRGEVIVDPDSLMLNDFRRRLEDDRMKAVQARAVAGAEARTRAGVRVLVGANVGSVADAEAASDADLIGLVRTEFLFLNRSEAPDVDEQEDTYRRLAEAAGGKRLTIRTLDVGGDKPLSYLPMPREANPFLGVRGLRLALRNPALLADQLLAVVRVAHEVPVSLMFPMVTTVDELLTARGFVRDAIERDGRPEPSGFQVGIMVEVPAVALRSETFAAHVDFFSIGTNDLAQYTLAVERGNEAVAALADPLDPAVLRLIRATVEGSAGKLVAVCGELAADERATAALVGSGVRELSVAPPAIPAVKEAVRQC